MKLFSVILLLFSYQLFSQTNIYFKYDDSGNQIYRGNDINGNKNIGESILEPLSTNNINENFLTNNMSEIISEELFWKELHIYPVPVKDVLTVKWTDKINSLISSVGLYQQSTIHWVFQSANIPMLNSTIQIDMASQYMGVYVLTFTLKDGRRFSKNITKY